MSAMNGAANAQCRPLIFSKSRLSNNFRKCRHCGTPSFEGMRCYSCGRFFDKGQRDIEMAVAKVEDVG
jgi:hypothetical protein